MTRKIVVLLAAMSVLAFLLAGCGGGNESESNGNGGETESVASGDPEAGEELYQQNCSSCHGEDAKGLPNLGRDLTTSEFVHSNSDQELLAFVKEGRSIDDPDNTTGVAMPPKGGNPALTDDQLLDIIAYIRTLEE